jgi:hypothetical protein
MYAWTELENPPESWAESLRWNMKSKSLAGSKLTQPIQAVEKTHHST